MATDGTQFYWVKRGDMSKLKCGRHHKHIFMGPGKFDNKHGVGTMLNKRWRQRIIDTEYINERAIISTTLVNRQHIKLMSVYFTHSKYADHHIQKMYKTIEKHMAHCNNYIPIIGGDFNAELGPGNGMERKSVGRYTLNEGKQKRWLDEKLADVARLHRLQHDASERHLRNRRPSYIEKAMRNKTTIFFTKRRHLKHIKDAEANDMIHMGSDHRVSWQPSQSQCQERTLIIKIWKENTTRRNVKEVHKLKKHQYRNARARENIQKSSK